MKIKYSIYLILFISVVFSSTTIYAQDKETDSQLASKYFSNREFGKAASLYEKIYSKTGSRIYFNYYLDCLKELKEFKKAEKIIKRQIKRDKNDLTYYVHYGQILKQQGQIKKSKEKYDDAIKHIGTTAYQVNSLANAFLRIKEFEYAEQTFLEARKKQLSNPFYTELAMVYAYQRKYSEMIDEFLDYVAILPEKLPIVENRIQAQVIYDTDKSLRKILKTKLLERIQNNDKLTVYNEFLIWVFIQEKKFKAAFMQSKALVKRNNENGNRLMELANLAISNHSYDVAIDSYNYIIGMEKKTRFFYRARLGLLDIYYQKVIEGQIQSDEEIIQLEADYKTTIKEFGNGSESMRYVKNLAHLQAFYLDRPNDAIELLKSSLPQNGKRSSLQGECKIELGDIYILVGEVWEAALVYGDVEIDFKHSPVGHEAKFKKAKLAYYTGDFQWAQAQLDVLKASTSKLISNDAFELSLLISDNTALDTTEVPLQMFANAELLVLQNKDSLAINVFDSIVATYKNHTLNDDILMQKSIIAGKNYDYDKELKYLTDITKEYNYSILADNALFRMAEIYEIKKNNKEKAMELYQKLLVEHKGSIFMTQARKRFRNLRGDKKDKTDDFFEYNQLPSF